jgi:deoxyribonuclease-4
VEKFRRVAGEEGVHPVYLHAIYLLNPSGPDAELRAKSVRSMREYLLWADRLGAAGVVVHLGSSAGTTPEEALVNLCDSLRAALQEPSDSPLLLETSAGTRNSMGSSFAAIGEALRRLDAGERAGVCLDTAHVFAAGYDVATPDGLESSLREFDREIGLEKLRLIHANDSKVALGAARDRHENIGEGYIGREGWRTLLGHPALRALPWVMETPGVGRSGPDAAQVQLLRRLWLGEPAPGDGS